MGIAYGRDRLWTDRKGRPGREFVHILVTDYRASVGVIRIVVVKLVPMVRTAIAVVERQVRQSVKITHDWLDPRLRVIGTVSESNTCAARVRRNVKVVVVVEIVSPRSRVRILDEICGRHGRISVRVGKVINVAGEQELRIRSSAAHHWLMVVIAYCVVLRQIEKVGEISLSHAVIAHCDTSLKGILVRHRWVSEPPSHGYRDPREKVALAAARVFRRDVGNRAIGLLPHLIEPMYGVTCVAGVSRVRDGLG